MIIQPWKAHWYLILFNCVLHYYIINYNIILYLITLYYKIHYYDNNSSIFKGGFHSREDVFSYDERTHPILKIVTTDVRNKCTLNFQGTSSAAPLAAGVMALTLEAK